MAGLPGSTPSLIPPALDEMARRMRDLERRMDELGPSVARSFGPVLAKIVQGGQAGTWVNTFGLSTTSTSICTLTIPIPDGYGHAIVFATAHASAHNTSATPDLLFVGASINNVTPAMIYAPGSAGAYIMSSGSASRSLSGLAGGNITVDLLVKTNVNTWPADASNLASIDAIVIFYV